MKKVNLINSKTVFISSAVVIPAVILVVYITGISNHRSLFLNSITSVSILTGIFLVFITTGLYRGWKLKDTLGNIWKQVYKIKFPEGIPNLEGAEFIEAGEGIEGCLLSIVLWIVIGVLGAVIFWLVGAFSWGTVLGLAAMAYWVFFRALRLIFRNSRYCKGDIGKSLQIAFGYTLLYFGWLYVVIMAGHYFAS